MNDALMLLTAWLAGLVLGAIFFVGLWWTVRIGVVSRQPALWFCGSLIVRTSIVLAGFYWVGRDHGGRLLVCLLGFVVARAIVTRFTGPPIELPVERGKEIRHAS